MAFNALEIIALVFVLAGLVKILIILISRNSWANFVKALYKRPGMLMLAELILAVIVLYYLSPYLSIVEIMAGIVLGALLTGMVFSAYGKELLPSMVKAVKTDVLKKAWVPILIWVILLIWTLGTLFGFI